MNQPFESMAEDEHLPSWILCYNFPNGVKLSLYRCEGGLWEIRGDNGRVIADSIDSWNHAITQWEALVPVRQ